MTLAICCYRQRPYVKDAIKAADKVREEIDAELIFVDDGSEDGSAEEARIALEFSKNYLLIVKRNQGLVHSLNLCLEVARGEYVQFIACDDLLLAHGIVTGYTKLVRRPTANFFIGNAYYFDARGLRGLVYRRKHDHYFSSESRPYEALSLYPTPLLLQTTIFKADFLRGIGGWESDLVLDDVPLFMRIFARRPRAQVDFLYDLDTIVCAYRIHPSNSHKNIIRQFQIFEPCVVRHCPSSIHKREIAHLIGVFGAQAVRHFDVRALVFLLATAFKRGVIWAAALAFLTRCFMGAIRVLLKKQ